MRRLPVAIECQQGLAPPPLLGSTGRGGYAAGEKSAVSRALAQSTTRINALSARNEHRTAGIVACARCSRCSNSFPDGAREMCVDSSLARWRKVLDVDLQAPSCCTQQALKRMLVQQRGVILQITSVHEIIPWAGYSAYTSAKAALSMFTKTAAQEVATQGVRVLAIAPRAIRTPINADVWGNPESLRDLDQKIAMARPGDPQEVGRVAAFLMSDLASYITGTTIAVDGGMLIYPDFSHGG